MPAPTASRAALYELIAAVTSHQNCAITTCALFNFYNRWITATGVPEMSAAAHLEQGRTLASRGYTRD